VAWDGLDPSVPNKAIFQSNAKLSSSNLPRGGRIGYKKAAVGHPRRRVKKSRVSGALIASVGQVRPVCSGTPGKFVKCRDCYTAEAIPSSLPIATPAPYLILSE